MDEAGDLADETAYFVMAGVLSRNNSDISRKRDEAIELVGSKYKPVRKFHFRDDNDLVKREFIGVIKEMDIKVTLLVIKKFRRISRKECFEELIKNVEIPSKGTLHIYVDDYLTNQKLRRNTEEELKRSSAKIISAKVKGIPVKVSFKKSLAGLEVADYLASMTWSYYERGKFKEYFDIIANKITIKEIEKK
ncbi:DUF3800 domain-containing protein [Metallosphaera tengchongensis]|uniref:DUF3800 domain-containing protein n=1 Tax=Metallosphaera tengchongensis TaxID=1532350 RepID=A0A6N0NXV4_9CREN|nr:DUF3800 domain-containing protein [Metallosphaera tengchongensis]QKR00703.1 DUF3800 domain-containing protein [Metallosphaera tengchongensis]